MNDSNSQPKQVVAKFNFKGTNNDELCFNKGDVITLTQIVDGGWWEGTLHGNTGWFPCNYVKERKHNTADSAKTVSNQQTTDSLTIKRETMAKYHQLVLQDLLVSEKSYVNDLFTLLQTTLRPLQTCGFLNVTEYQQLIGNLEEILPFQQEFLAGIDDCAKLSHVQQRVGGYFIRCAPRLKLLYESYWSNHPWAVALLQKKKDEFVKHLEATGSQGFMQLTASLSQPFLRLDKYCSLLKELERHIEDSHPDRGDTQRAVAVFKDIISSCGELRKLKEMEYDVLNGSISNWEGEEIQKLGEIILFSQVRLLLNENEKKECIFVLFSTSLVILSISARMSGYIYEGRMPVTGLIVNKLEDTELISNALELTGAGIERKVVLCGTLRKQNQWFDTLKNINPSVPGHHNKPQTPNSSVVAVPTSHHATMKSNHMSYDLTKSSMATPSSGGCLKTASSTPSSVGVSTWTMSCLRPSAPLRPSFAQKEDPSKSPRSVRKTSSFRRKHVERTRSEDDTSIFRKYDMKANEEDAVLLRVIESYCTSARARHTINSSLFDRPSLLIAEDEKIIMDDMEEKSLVDTVYSLKDDVKDLQKETKRLRRDLDQEVGARRKIEKILRNSRLQNMIGRSDDHHSSSTAT